MPLFGVRVSVEGHKIMEEISNNSKHPYGMMFIVPMNIARVKDLWVFDVNPRLPPLYIFGVIILLGGIMFYDSLPTWARLVAFIGGGFISLTAFVYNWRLYYALLRYRLRRDAPGASVQPVGLKMIVREALYGRKRH